MEENRKQKPRDFKDIKKIMRELLKLKLMQVILYPLIIFGIIGIFIFILQGINLLIIIIDFIIVAIYLISLKYIYAFRKTLKITKRELKRSIEMKKKEKDMSILQIIFYSIVILITIVILIFSMDSIDPWILLIIISFVPIFTFFDNNLDDIKNIKS